VTYIEILGVERVKEVWDGAQGEEASVSSDGPTAPFSADASVGYAYVFLGRTLRFPEVGQVGRLEFLLKTRKKTLYRPG
jgi:hypothetical protein